MPDWIVWVGGGLLAAPATALVVYINYAVWRDYGWSGVALYWAVFLGLLLPTAAGVLLLGMGLDE
jgi:hypothetical protein